MIFKKLIFLIFLVSTSSLYSQVHHQTISVQSSNFTNSQFHVFQSIGQLSPIGNYTTTGKQSVFQGFQQPLLRKININPVNLASVLLYPNPFTEKISFQFVAYQPKNLKISIFDLNGKFIKEFNKEIESNVLELTLDDLKATSYIITMKGFNFLYSTIIIKK